MCRGPLRDERGTRHRVTRPGAIPGRGTHMNTTRTALSALGTAAMVVAGVAATTTAGSAAEARAVDVCELRILSVKALDLQEDGVQGNDEIYLRLGDFRSVARRYTEGQKRNVLATDRDVFVGTESVRLVEQDGGPDDVLDSRSIPCVQRLGQSSIVGNGDAIYELQWRVRVL